MQLPEELQQLIQAVVAGVCPLLQLREWLEAHDEAIASAEDDRLDELAGLLWTLFAERDRGHRDELSVRRELALVVPGRYTIQLSWIESAVTVGTATVSINCRLPLAAPQFGTRTRPEGSIAVSA